MTAYAATFDATQPEKFDRVQLAVRLAIMIVLGFVGSLLGLLYIGIPVLAAVMISQKGAAKFHAEAPDNMSKWLRYLLGFYGYMGLLTDKLPGSDEPSGLRMDIRPTGTPTVGSALLRIIMVIPHLIVLWLLGIVTGILLIIAAIFVLVQESYPKGIYDFIRGYWRWYGRMMAYLASMVDEYPPFAFDTGPEDALPSSTSQPMPEA